MSNTIPVQQFLIGKTFQIPIYQRDYAWTTKEVNDLLSDIQEAFESGSTHYLGTLVIAGEDEHSYEIVDGQQRLSTLVLIIHALLQQLSQTDEDRTLYEFFLLRDLLTKKLKLNFGKNDVFVNELFNKKSPTPQSIGQRKLFAAYNFASDRAMALAAQSSGVELIKSWLETIKLLEIIQFVAKNTGLAVRMFQTVNDRGMPLTMMDKAKALLISYSSKYLAGRLDEKINSAFGDCFSNFDEVREFVKHPGYSIDNITRDTFTEDDILRYHYLAYSNELALYASNYNATIKIVFEEFLKETLKKLCQEPKNLELFISDYISDLSLFADAFKELIFATAEDKRLYSLFIILGLSSRLYPLTIRLHQKQQLLTPVYNKIGTSIDILHCIEVCDVRVYKIGNSDPGMHIGELSHKSRTATVPEISDSLKNFTMHFMPDSTFQARLSQDMYRNGALVPFLIRKDEVVSNSAYHHDKLCGFVKDKITREHIIAQTPDWSISSQGFIDDADFKMHLHMFGNLTLLSHSHNSRCGQASTHTKMTDVTMYAKSAFAETRQLAQQYSLSGSAFTKAEILVRTQYLTSFVMKEWAIW